MPAIPVEIADRMTLVTTGAIAAVIDGRFSNLASRKLGRTQDWLLPSLLVTIFAAGYLTAMHGLCIGCHEDPGATKKSKPEMECAPCHQVP